MSRWLLGALAVFVPCLANASTLDLNINDDAARLSLRWPLGENQLRLGAGWLHHQDRGDILHLGFHLADLASSGPNPVRAGIGMRLHYMDAESQGEGGALGIGGFLRYTLPQYDRIAFGGHLYFAPDVVSFDEVEQYTEFAIHVSYNVIRDADLYLGYRNSNADFGGLPDVTFDTGLHVGLRLNF